MLPVIIGLGLLGVGLYVVGSAEEENERARDDYMWDLKNAQNTVNTHYETQKQKEKRKRKTKAKKLQQEREHILMQEHYARKKEYSEIQQNLKKHKILLSELFEQKHQSKHREEKREIQKHINQVLEIRKTLFSNQDKLKNMLNNNNIS